MSYIGAYLDYNKGIIITDGRVSNNGTTKIENFPKLIKIDNNIVGFGGNLHDCSNPINAVINELSPTHTIDVDSLGKCIFLKMIEFSRKKENYNANIIILGKANSGNLAVLSFSSNDFRTIDRKEITADGGSPIIAQITQTCPNDFLYNHFKNESDPVKAITNAIYDCAKFDNTVNTNTFMECIFRN